MNNEDFFRLIKKLINSPNDLKFMLQGYLDQKNENIKETKTFISKGSIDMKGITKRPNGLYMIRVQRNGKRNTVYAKTITEAKSLLSKLRKNKVIIIKEEKKKQTIKLEEFTNIWFNNYKKPFIKESTAKMVLKFLKQINKKFGQLPINQITSVMIQEYLNKLSINRTKENIRIYFNAIMQKAYELDYIEKNPFITVIKDKKLKLKKYCFNYNEQKQILTAIKNTDIEHEIYIYLMTGCRPNEFPNKQCFDFQNNLIHIYGTKTETSKHRTIEMSENFSQYIKKYLLQNELKTPAYIKNKFKEICENIKIKDPVIYRLRHTFATNHFTLGTQSKYVQEWLGHSSVKLTLDIYTDIDKTSSKEKIKELYKDFYYEIIK